ncbi:chloride channel protein [Lacticaseibacillus daqingensis]|uniref:chloride channel protein n=1 Tax=Lacticaseibacillus daqingensis TaxID=2486014 RepID=UPI000F7B7CB2|nr:chloride channel protein [Lacticaseibacillus daqingensis]
MKSQHNGVLLLVTVTCGVLAGLGAVALSLFLELVTHVLLNFTETAAHPAALAVSPVRRVAVLVGGGLVAAILWWWVRNRMRPTVSVKNAVHGQTMPGGTTVVHTFTQMLFVGAGGSVGRELAPRELAAMLAQWWQRVLVRWGLQLSAADQHLIVAAAAGAGFAGVYIAPITGMLFAVEILLQRVSRRAVVVSLTMSVIATFVGATLKGFKPYYLLASTPFSPRLAVALLAVGPVCGVVGAVFRRAIQWAAVRQAQRRPLLWQLPLAALATGLIAIVFPQVCGNGRAFAQLVFDNRLTALVPLLLLGALVKALVTLMSIAAGAAGGTLTPSIAVGAAVGAAVGTAINLWVTPVVVWQCAVVGAAAVLAVTQQAPLMAMMMVFEVSHLSYAALLPLALGIALAMVVANWFTDTRTLPPETVGETETADLLQSKGEALLAAIKHAADH